MGEPGTLSILINDRASGPAGTGGALLWEDGRLTDLDAVAGGAGGTRGVDINERGQVLCLRLLPDSHTSALVWTLPTG